MRVRVRFFAALRERVGAGTTRTLRAGTTVGTLWRMVIAEHPDVATMPVRFAVDERYVEAGYRLADGDEVAIFPPVSGGSTSCR